MIDLLRWMYLNGLRYIFNTLLFQVDVWRCNLGTSYVIYSMNPICKCTSLTHTLTKIKFLSPFRTGEGF